MIVLKFLKPSSDRAGYWEPVQAPDRALQLYFISGIFVIITF